MDNTQLYSDNNHDGDQTIKIMTMESGKQAMATVTPTMDIAVRPFDDEVVSEEVVTTSAENAQTIIENIGTCDVAFDTIKENITITPKEPEEMPGNETPAEDAKEVITLSGRIAS